MAKSKKQSVTARRLAVLANGYLPLPAVGKAVYLDGWPEVVATSEMICAWEQQRGSELNTSILTRTTPAVDNDIKDAVAAEALEKLVRERFNGAGRLLRRIGLPPKRAFLFKTETPFSKLQQEFIAPDGSDKHKLEILGDGQQIVIDGIHPDTKQPYTWAGGEPWSVARDDLPVLTEGDARAWLEAATALLVGMGWQIKSKDGGPQTTDQDLPLIVQLGVRQWGAWSRANVRGEYRFGTHGSKAVDALNRTWFDFEDNIGGGVKDLMRLVEARGKDEPQSEEIITVTPHNFPDEKTLPLWDFLYGKHLLRRTVSITAATGGTGKSTKAIADAIAMTSGRSIIGEQVSRPLRVMHINLEDNREACDKRIAGAMKHHGLKPADIGGRLFTKAKGELKFKVATRTRAGTVVRNEAVIKALINLVVENQIDVLSIDPLIKTHSVRENDSSEMETVIGCYDDIAEQGNCAVSLWHHTRKPGGGEVTIESVRGSSAAVDACRSARILETMSKEEAEKLKLQNGGYYFREFSGKLNFAPPSEKSTWYQFVNVELENSKLFGDNVGLVTSWTHPNVAKKQNVTLTSANIAEIKRVVGVGKWREDFRAGLWVGKAVAQVLGLNHEDDVDLLKRVVKSLLDGGALKVVQGKDDNRKTVMFVIPAATNAEFQPVVVGPAPAGVNCVQCQIADGRPVYRIRDGRVPRGQPGGKPECLHDTCAEAWFTGGAPVNTTEQPSAG